MRLEDFEIALHGGRAIGAGHTFPVVGCTETVDGSGLSTGEGWTPGMVPRYPDAYVIFGCLDDLRVGEHLSFEVFTDAARAAEIGAVYPKRFPGAGGEGERVVLGTNPIYRNLRRRFDLGHCWSRGRRRRLLGRFTDYSVPTADRAAY